ncbi:Cobalamin biosynthesis protein CbiG / Cobalt-precorrin-3b C17-methyltransferase [hydrothermal vent metagenome]|uniref:Cobalamin biosynthesis protein CbiG / Cobalt-precorrin-3b C17-methyltransferase n=1 Tax=hydrothermal vent metagenome TaxID=652676 RepID=A0A3B0U9D0_9ZZZZ
MAAITTASSARFSCALDETPPGYVLANPERAKPAMAAILNGEHIALDGKADWLEQAGYPISSTGTVKITVSETIIEDESLVFHPKTLIAGVGCERGVSSEEVIALVEKTLDEHKLAQKSLAAIATIDLKADEKAINEAAAYFKVPLRLFSAAELAEEAKLLPNPSKIVLAEVGTPGVAEAAAIKAGTLLVEKQKSTRATCAIGRATCAIGRADAPLDVANFGMARGRLDIVGIGPGSAEQRTISVVQALEGARDWVGYGFYLDLIADLDHGQTEHRFGLGDEEKRVRHALELAAIGKNVALICSGDAQIYAMAALVFELLETDGKRAVSDKARRVEIISHPGISALQMASARAGALIGHDFCAISLSDLLTPRAQIEKRLLAAAKGDFVTAFYNPRSKRRTDLLDKAKQLFLAHRPPQTPVIIASSLGRNGEKVRVVELVDFDPGEIDMMSIVLFGASKSKAFKRGDGKTMAFTPRGYASKQEKAQ